jgi:hypothetical protein
MFVCMLTRARVCVGDRVLGHVYARYFSLAYSTCNAYAPYCDVIFGLSGSTIPFDIISQTA